MVDAYVVGQLLINGILIGTVYGLMGLGLSLVFGVMGVVNSAHGAFYMLGGYLTYLVLLSTGIDLLLAQAVAIAGLFVIAVAIEKLMINRTRLEEGTVMIMTLGIAVMVQGLVLVFFGPSYVPLPSIASGTLKIASVSIDLQLFIALIVSLAAAFTLGGYLKITRIGKAMRAVAQNRELAEIMGVDVFEISTYTFALGTVLAGLAGLLLSPIYTLNPSSGWVQLVISFVVVIIGGLGSIRGTILAGLIYGVVDSYTQFFIPKLTSINILVVMILILLFRPSGLFGTRLERA